MCAPAIIHQLRIERFRGIENLQWNPAPGMNVILGGGDVGKSTLLDGIALLLSPSNNFILSEADFWQRKYDQEFVIQAVISLPASTEISHQPKFSWPWGWNGEDAVSPVIPDSEEDDIPTPDTPVYRIQVRGTPELEIVWEVIQPNDDVDLLSAAVRRKIGCVRLGGDERNDRDLRLVYGSALDRLLADKGLRARIGQKVSEIDLQDNLGEDAKSSLQRLDDILKEDSLPNKLELGLTSSQGLSIGALVGLLAERAHGIPLPLTSWGSGTRRMATLQIAAATETETRITVIDEIERGLEPYRVRKLVKSIQDQATQCFVTTHSPVAIGSADKGCLWYLDQAGNIGELPRSQIAKQQDRDPETFLSRLAIIAEGPTEIGFVSSILEHEIGSNLIDSGLRVCNGQGNPAVLALLEAMAFGNLTFGGFVDNESDSPGRWQTLKESMGDLLFRWESGCTEENVISLVAEDKLLELLKGPDGEIDHERCSTLAMRLDIEDKTPEEIKAAADDLRKLIIEAATGNTDNAPDGMAKIWKKHGNRWFKSESGGRELASKMLALGVWPELKPKMLPFLSTIRESLAPTSTEPDE